jgi:predicted CXXCH cytochrome family protein
VASSAESQATPFANYAGSGSCRQCHQEEYSQWAKSHHGLAERNANSNICQAAFPESKTGEFAVTIASTNSKPETYVVDWVIGDDPLIQFLVGTSGGRWQAFANVWDPRRQEWFNVFGTEVRLPGEWGHWTGRGMNWNSMCAFCHNTRLLKNYDPSSDTYHTAMAEMSVGCGACHGPAKAHVEWERRNTKREEKDPSLPAMSRSRRLDACGACHARRSELTGDFKPGDNFLDDFDLAMVDGTDLYYPDGQVREEDYEYASFLGSAMRASGVDCLDCHQPHSAKTRLPGNFLCLRCHNGSYTNAPVIDPVAHSHHRVHGYNANSKLIDTDLAHFQTDEIQETGGQCVNCHMPQKVYMQRQSRHDHGLTIPDPLLTKECGVPNACNQCHRDKEVSWAVTQVDQWYGKLMDRPARQRTRWLAAARSANPGAVEPLLKILVAETNSYWKAAIINVLQPWSAEPSVAAVLRQSLDDTSALVRAKAARALDTGVENQSVRSRLEDPVRSVRVAAAWAVRGELDMNSRAGRDLNLFLDVNADQPGGQLQLGQFFLARGEPNSALEHYRKAAAWDPASGPIHRDLAVLYSLLHQDHEALEQLREAVRLEPQDAEYHFSLALALNDTADLDRAIVELREAVRLNPRHADAWRNLGLALAGKDDLADAAEALARAEAVDPEDPRIPYSGATVLARLGRDDEARTAAARALKLRPDYPEAQELLQRLSSQRK